MKKWLLQDCKLEVCGTHGRKWYTDEINNIAFSFFIETNCKIEKVEGITVEIAETMIDVLKKLYNIELQIKFPNDIVYNGRKIGGILTQTKLSGEMVKYIVVGVRVEYESRKI